MNYSYSLGQIVNYGNKKVTIEELREFWGTPSYKVSWVNSKNKVERAILKEKEIS